MYSGPRLAFKYLQYYLTSSNGHGHGIHSPFVFEFVTKVLNDKKDHPDYHEIESLRNDYLREHSEITVNDLGAGSAHIRSNTRKISSIAKHALKPSKFAQLLYRMIAYYKPINILELGTSLGITTAYLAKANPNGRVITLEGSEEIFAKAKAGFEHLGLQNIEAIPGNFDHMLQPLVDQLSSVDFAFIDGNHRLQPTIGYFNSILPKINSYSIIILDDIHWSREMEEAWKYCKEEASVTLTIDLFFIGILVFRKEIREKQHFVIRF